MRYSGHMKSIRARRPRPAPLSLDAAYVVLNGLPASATADEKFDALSRAGAEPETAKALSGVRWS